MERDLQAIIDSYTRQVTIHLIGVLQKRHDGADTDWSDSVREGRELKRWFLIQIMSCLNSNCDGDLE